jgi:hypothetical protein
MKLKYQIAIACFIAGYFIGRILMYFFLYI